MGGHSDPEWSDHGYVVISIRARARRRRRVGVWSLVILYLKFIHCTDMNEKYSHLHLCRVFNTPQSMKVERGADFLALRREPRSETVSVDLASIPYAANGGRCCAYKKRPPVFSLSSRRSFSLPHLSSSLSLNSRPFSRRRPRLLALVLIMKSFAVLAALSALVAQVYATINTP